MAIKDQKIDLPEGYELVSPQCFSGFQIELDSLCIRNEYGEVSWIGKNYTLDTRKVNFMTSLSISEQTLEIENQQLQRGDILVQFYDLPRQIKANAQKGNNWIENKLKKNLENNKNITFMGFEAQNSHWKIKISQ